MSNMFFFCGVKRRKNENRGSLAVRSEDNFEDFLAPLLVWTAQPKAGLLSRALDKVTDAWDRNVRKFAPKTGWNRKMSAVMGRSRVPPSPLGGFLRGFVIAERSQFVGKFLPAL